MVGIPKTMGHIWIGCRQAPTEWMETWRQKHPDWKYVIYDNEYLTSRRWRNQKLIEEYFRRKVYAGVSDLMRYEILFDEGGFIPEADSVCLRSTDELFQEPSLYSVYENEQERPGYISPFLASSKGHPFLKTVIDDIGARHTPETLGFPWRSVGNKYLSFMLEEHQPNITIFPSHYFVPRHFTDRLEESAPIIEGDVGLKGPVYANQMWGSTRKLYKTHRPWRQKHIRQTVLSALQQEETN